METFFTLNTGRLLQLGDYSHGNIQSFPQATIKKEDIGSLISSQIKYCTLTIFHSLLNIHEPRLFLHISD